MMRPRFIVAFNLAQMRQEASPCLKTAEILHGGERGCMAAQGIAESVREGGNLRKTGAMFRRVRKQHTWRIRCERGELEPCA
jgi:hypothetical protein